MLELCLNTYIRIIQLLLDDQQIDLSHCIVIITLIPVKYCQEYFGFDLPSVLWIKRMQKFEVKFGLYLSS